MYFTQLNCFSKYFSKNNVILQSFPAFLHLEGYFKSLWSTILYVLLIQTRHQNNQTTLSSLWNDL